MCSQLHKPRTNMLLHSEQAVSGVDIVLEEEITEMSLPVKQLDAASQLFHETISLTACTH